MIYLDETGVGASYYELVNDRVIVFHKKQKMFNGKRDM